MKSNKNYLILLLALAAFTFSACEDSDDFAEQGIPNTINTFAPEVGENSVTFRGKLSQPDGAIEYGFMWYQKDNNGNAIGETQRVVVGAGNLNGEFEKIMLDLPRGANMVVCAFVDYDGEFQDVINAIGEEVDFTFDN